MRVVVAVTGPEVQLARSALGILDDPPVLRDLGRVVRQSHLVVEQLAARIPKLLLQLRSRIEELVSPIELLNALRQRAQ
jgi:hypothetical protein